MTIDEKIAAASGLLRDVWEVLLRERQGTLARVVEGVLAELTDERLNAAERLQRATREWRTINRHPHGLPDWGVWPGDEAERLVLKREFEQHREAVNRLLS